LLAFQGVLGEALARSGSHYTPLKRFTPHMTLLYDHRSIDMRPVEPVRWKVREFVLIRSLVGQHKHDCLGRWELKQENPTIH
jgi:2'-5' RNA ligase